MDRTDGFVNGQTPICRQDNLTAWRGPGAAPRVQMSHRHLVTVAIKRSFLIIFRLYMNCRRATVEEICVSEHGQRIPAPVGHTPATGSGRIAASAVRASTAGRDVATSSSLAPTKCGAQ